MTAIRTPVEENGKDGGAGVRFLTETVTSPTLIAQMKQVATELPNSRWVQYEPVNKDNAMAGAKLAFGSPAQPYINSKRLKGYCRWMQIFFRGSIRAILAISQKAGPSRTTKRDQPALCGGNDRFADGSQGRSSLAVKPSQMPEIAKAIAKALGVSGANSTYLITPAWIAALAKDLLAQRANRW